MKTSTKIYSDNNKKVIKDEKPILFDLLLKKIKEKNPDIIAFSVVYSSQAFYTYSFLKELKDYTTIIGGPPRVRFPSTAVVPKGISWRINWRGSSPSLRKRNPIRRSSSSCCMRRNPCSRAADTFVMPCGGTETTNSGRTYFMTARWFRNRPG